MAALRRMAIPQDNRHLLVEAGILAMLARAGRSGEVEIQREVIGWSLHHCGQNRVYFDVFEILACASKRAVDQLCMHAGRKLNSSPRRHRGDAATPHSRSSLFSPLFNCKYRWQPVYATCLSVSKTESRSPHDACLPWWHYPKGVTSKRRGRLSALWQTWRKK